MKSEEGYLKFKQERMAELKRYFREDFKFDPPLEHTDEGSPFLPTLRELFKKRSG